MRLRTHISPVVCLLVALAALAITSDALAQEEFVQTPFMPPVRQSLVGGRFYIQGGLLFRSLQRVGFEKKPIRVRIVESAGVVPFGPAQPLTGSTVAFSTALGSPSPTPGAPAADPIPGNYPNFPDPAQGACAAAPISGVFGAQDTPYLPSGLDPARPDMGRSGIWEYDNGRIRSPGSCFDCLCTGDTSADYFRVEDTNIWPHAPIAGSPIVTGLGQYDVVLPEVGVVCPGGAATCSSDTVAIDVGSFTFADAAGQLTGGTTFNTATSASWSRILNATVNGSGVLGACGASPYGAVADATMAARNGCGVESRIWYGYGQELGARDSLENIWTPSIEVGFQLGDSFDLFYGFSWYDLGKTLSGASPAGTTAQLWRTQFTDTFSWRSNSIGTIAGGPWVLPMADPTTEYQISADSPGAAGWPVRTFSEAGTNTTIPFTELYSARTDFKIREHRLGVRSWTPLYGMGRFGVNLGALVNQVYFRGSASGMGFVTYPSTPPLPVGVGIVPPVVTSNTFVEGWTVAYGATTGIDIELGMRQFYVKTSVQYNLVEQKTVDNGWEIMTNLNMSGFSSILVGGVRF